MNASLDARLAAQDAQWFASWFDSIHYRKLYAHRDASEAAAFVDALVSRLQPRLGASALDLGCGTGRHARQLASKGLAVTGMDLSATSILLAKRFEGRRLRFRRHDMRVPFGRDIFDYVFSFFTSFGYFDDDADHLAVISNIASSLSPGGRVVLDYLNVAHAEAHMVRDQAVVVEGTTYLIRRWSDERHFFKRIVANDRSLAGPAVWREQVAKFTLEDFERLFEARGLEIVEAYGDYRLGAYDRQSSPRLVMVARKTQ